MEGNRPSNVLLAEILTPRILGMLVALYEHSVFTHWSCLGHRPVRPWGSVGMELGKVLAVKILPELASAAESALEHGSWTNALIRRYCALEDR